MKEKDLLNIPKKLKVFVKSKVSTQNAESV